MGARQTSPAPNTPSPGTPASGLLFGPPSSATQCPTIGLTKKPTIRTQSLVDMIVDQDEHHHAPLLALMILSLSLGDEYLQRTGIGERRDN